MKKSTFPHFAIDNSAILYLSLIRKDHTNTYRFTMSLKEPICPETLQLAVDRVYHRFPSVIAGFHPGCFHYFQVPAKTPPLVQPDPGCLITMSKEEIQSCAYRVYYKENTIAIEAFHALADGFGAVASFTTLVAEYLRLKHSIHIPVQEPLVDLMRSPAPYELKDSYLEYAQGNPLHLPSRFAYQLPGGNGSRNTMHIQNSIIPAQLLLGAAHRYGVSITTLISSVLAKSIMEVQFRQSCSKRKNPVRIMVPVDLRRMFPSRTLRNFILYVLPTMEPQDFGKPLSALMHDFSAQIRVQADKTRMASIMAYNVKTQRSWYFRFFPLFLKCALMRLVYRFFGESNSSVTLTNLGNVVLPAEMQEHVTHMDVTLTPRVRSPYNCAILSYNGQVSINISRFPAHSELEAIFQKNLNAILFDESTL